MRLSDGSYNNLKLRNYKYHEMRKDIYEVNY